MYESSDTDPYAQLSPAWSKDFKSEAKLRLTPSLEAKLRLTG